MTVEFSPEEEAIIVSAKEDYLSLGQAVLEAPRDVVMTLFRRGFLRLLELEQDETGTREIRSVDAEADAILENPVSWTPPLQQGPRFFALAATQKGEEAFFQIIGRRRR